MAITEGNMARERTRREAIDEMLLRACYLTEENQLAARRLRDLLIGAPPEAPTPDRERGLGWLGEVADALENSVGHLVATARVLEEISTQVAPLMSTAEPLRKLTR